MPLEQKAQERVRADLFQLAKRPIQDQGCLPQVPPNQEVQNGAGLTRGADTSAFEDR